MIIKYVKDDEEISVKLPSKRVVCTDCAGYGHTLHPSMRDHAYTQEEFNEAFDDDQRNEYFKRGGIYDVVCKTCKGDNVVDAVDEDRLTEAQSGHYVAWSESRAEDAAYEAMCRAERAMGA